MSLDWVEGGSSSFWRAVAILLLGTTMGGFIAGGSSKSETTTAELKDSLLELSLRQSKTEFKQEQLITKIDEFISEVRRDWEKHR